MNDLTSRQKGIRRTVIILSTIAVLFYVGFIMMGVLRA